MSTTVGIVEDVTVLGETLTRLVDGASDFRCVATCASGEDAIRDLPAHIPEVVRMDWNLPHMTGIKCIRRLKGLLPPTQVIVLTVHEDSEHIFRALKAGANGYLLKRAEPEEIIEAILNARDGGAPISSQIARLVENRPRR